MQPAKGPIPAGVGQTISSCSSGEQMPSYFGSTQDLGIFPVFQGTRTDARQRSGEDYNFTTDVSLFRDEPNEFIENKG
jgi:hypothetical protein